VPTRVLLEGPAIEPLLAQVRDEYGSSVRIISADKVRSGGFGGFFAKQHYELSVEVPDPDEQLDRPHRRPVAEPAQTLEQLLARAESRDRITPDDGPVTADRVTGRTAGLTDAEAAAGRPGFPAPAPGAADPGAAFAELMAGLDRADTSTFGGAAARPERPDSPTVRPFRPAQATGSPVNGGASGGARSLPPVPSLAELRGGLGVGEAAGYPPNPAANRAAQNPAPPRTPAAAYGLAPTSPAPTAGPAGLGLGGPPSGTQAAGLAGLGLDGPPNAGLGLNTPPGGTPAAGLAETLAGLGLGTPPGGTPNAGLAETLAGLGLGTPPAAAPGGGIPGAEQPAAALRPAHLDPVRRNLMAVGMPEAMVAEIVGGDTYAGVLSVLAARPSAPEVPDAPGEILVLCGDIAHALPIGRKLCEQAGIDQAHLLLGGPTAAGTGVHSSRVLGDPEAAATKAERLQKADHAWIVLLDAQVGGTDPIWISDMCDAVGATAVWAVVDATRKTADTARHLRALGDVEALVVHGVDITSDPATVLGLDLPIVSLDGKPATPHAWAAMLCARIAADVVPMAALPRRPARGR
jgi:hypothetical protein